MKHKFFRALEYAKQLLLLLFFLPAGFLVKLLCPKFRHVWLVMERGNDARDNGYHFYRYLKTAHPEIRAYYVIDPKSPDRDKIAPLGGLVNYRSFRHYLLYYAADYLISTHVQPCAPDMILFYHLAPKHIGSPAKQIFLQHGIIKDEMKWLHRENLKIDLFVCGAKPEYEYIKSTFGHPENVPQYLGLCRFDHLLCASKPEKMILVMPTWRGSHYPSGAAFENTTYFHAFHSLLNNPELARKLAEEGYTLIFYPHVEMQKYMPLFRAHAPSCKNIILADRTTHDVQDLLMRCSLLITDYSSVFFDVAYLHKPVIYYQFDDEEFRAYHYQEGYFDYKTLGFGPVCDTEDALLEQISQAFVNHMQMSPLYQKRTNEFFPLRDDSNCKRTYEAIRRLK